MSWLSTCAKDGHVEAGALLLRDGLLTRGTLMLEFAMEPGSSCRPRKLIAYENDTGWSRSFTIFLNPDRSIAIEHRQGKALCYGRVSGLPADTEHARLVYSWDGPRRIGLLTLEGLDSLVLNQAVIAAPMPLPVADARAMLAGQKSAVFRGPVSAVALADHWMRVGPVPTLAPDATIDTPDGPRLMRNLRRGDLVTTAQHGDQPVRWIARDRRPNVGWDRPVRLRAPYLGLDEDLVISGSGRVEIPTPPSLHDLPEGQMLVEASALSTQVRQSGAVSGLAFDGMQILLDVHDCIRANGVWVETAFVGSLGLVPDIVPATQFGHLGATALPRHAHRAGIDLARHEKLAMLDEFAA